MTAASRYAVPAQQQAAYQQQQGAYQQQYAAYYQQQQQQQQQQYVQQQQQPAVAPTIIPIMHAKTTTTTAASTGYSARNEDELQRQQKAQQHLRRSQSQQAFAERKYREHFEQAGLSNEDIKMLVPQELRSGSSSYNMIELLASNIRQSSYFDQLSELTTVPEVIDEIHSEVKHLEPFIQGKQRAPSTAFCLLYKLFILKLTHPQLDAMIKRGGTSNAFCRGLGFLYLRYVLPPARLWDYMSPYLDDDEPVHVSGASAASSTTIGAFCKELLTTLKYHRTLFPRIPVPIAREIKKALLVRDMAVKEASRNAKYFDALHTGLKCEAKYAADGKYYAVQIDELLPREQRVVATWIAYGNSEELPFSSIRITPEIKQLYAESSSSSSSRGRHRRRNSRSASPRRRNHGGRGRNSRSRSRSPARLSRRRVQSYARRRSPSPDNMTLEQKVLQQERDSAVGQSRKVSSYKSMTSMKLSTATNRRRSRTPPRRRQRSNSRGHQTQHHQPSAAAAAAASAAAEESAERKQPSEAHIAKMAALKSRYG
jgi:pre-mRNA-splicing factor 38B